MPDLNSKNKCGDEFLLTKQGGICNQEVFAYMAREQRVFVEIRKDCIKED